MRPPKWDGAPRWRVFRRITLPLLAPTMVVVVVLSLIRAVQAFDEIYVFTGGGPGSATLLLLQYIYDTGFATRPRLFGLAAAALDPDGRLAVLAHAPPASRHPRAVRGRHMSPFLLRTRGRHRLDLTDWLAWGFLVAGLFLMLGPVLWLLLSSFKTEAALQEYPPTLLPLETRTVVVPGHDDPLPLYRITAGAQAGRELAQIRRIGLNAQMIDPADPETKITVAIGDRAPVRRVAIATQNYTGLFERFDFPRYFWNSTFITVVATVLTVLFNSMAAFALSKYRFRGRTAVFLLIISTLMIPPTVNLVPIFLVVNELGLVNSPWGVIWPAIATPTGVFLLRQYMLSIPDDLLDAARMDHASEWRVYWRIVLPLSLPAIAVLIIFSVMWRWNEFLWPLIVLNRSEEFTLQLALNSFQGDLTTTWSSLLAMTMLTLLPITIVFPVPAAFHHPGHRPVGGQVDGPRRPARPRQGLRADPRHPRRRPRRRGRQFLRLRRPLGLWQVDAATDDRGARGHLRGRPAHRRRARQRPARRRARPRDGVPDLRALPAHDRAAEPPPSASRT